MLVPRPSAAEQSHTSAPERPLVRVVDDEPSIRSLFQRIGELAGFEVKPYQGARELLLELDESRPGCVVLDQVMPDLTGIDVLKELAARDSQLPVIFMSGLASVAEAVAALKLGSIDFIEKPFQLDEMIETMRRAIALDASRRAAAADEAQLIDRLKHLTPRENEVMERIVRGAANKEVAAELGLSPKTVEVHRANIMRKTQAGSLAELVRLHVAVRP